MKRVLLILGLCFFSHFASAQQTAHDILRQKTEKQLQAIVDSSSALTGLMAVDLTSGETIGINSEIVFAQASAIKIPILMEVYKQAHEKRFTLSDTRPLLSSNSVGGSGILNAMVDPVSLSIRNLCVLMIGLSDNSATNTLIDLVGIPAINKTMISLGLTNTKVQRKMIDVNASLRGDENISTPAEAIKILKLLYDGKFINKNLSDEIISILQKNSRDNSKLAKALPSNVNIAFKPGGMGGVSTEWAIVYLANRPYAVAVMENYKLQGTATYAMSAVSRTLFHYFSRAKATKYGVIVQ